MFEHPADAVIATSSLPRETYEGFYDACRVWLNVSVREFSPHGQPNALFAYSAAFPYSRPWSRREWLSGCGLGWFCRPGHGTGGLCVFAVPLVVHF
jgi:hypothetical protein